jgi:hypothetical protein
MAELNYRLVRDSLGFYSQEPIEEPVQVEQVEQTEPKEEPELDLASLGGLQTEELPRKQRGRPRRKIGA